MTETTEASGDDGSCATRNAHAAVAVIPSATAHKQSTLKPSLEQAELLWRELRDNELGGYSGINRPFWILAALKRAYTNGKEDERAGR